ncbi:GTPase [uncultured Brachyspira sp.]|uniref:GTPase n=1 Tax=uncultured Brachyspira sp. TaxID=221953 RepID=UPI00262AE7A9|nr:GTPase [uncultured Brachyspira sp.]
MSENNQKLNLLILGQHASGKSALINSFVGNNIKASDNPIEVKVDNRDVVIFESNTNFQIFLESADKNSFVITYCVSSNSIGISDEDASMIKKIIIDEYSVIIALTKSDLSVKEQLTELVKNIKEKTKCYRIVTISNIEANNYFGVEEYKKAVFRAFKRNNTENYIELNLLVLGQTGVGKSSLLNALVGKKIEETGIGKPCTPEGIFPHEETIDGKDVVIYDSWGLEVGKSDKWYNMIKEELKYRSVDKDMKDWYHSVTYCIQAGGAKIQDFDINIIKQFLEDKYNVIVALTKADQLSEEKEKEFIEIIKNETGVETVIAVGAAPEIKRGMKETPKPFGLEEYKYSILASWRKIFIDRIPLHIIEKIKIDINKKRDELKKKDFKENDLKKLSDSIKEEFDTLVKNNMQEYVKTSIQKYYKVSETLYSINKDIDIFSGNDHEIYGFYSFVVDLFSHLLISDVVIDIGDVIGSILATIIVSPVVILATVIGGLFDIGRLIHYNLSGKKEDINYFIDRVADGIIENISSEENKKFENNLRDAINEILEKSDEELKNRLENNKKE